MSRQKPGSGALCNERSHQERKPREAQPSTAECLTIMADGNIVWRRCARYYLVSYAVAFRWPIGGLGFRP